MALWGYEMLCVVWSGPNATSPLDGGLGLSVGDFEGWKPQQVGGCGWTRCPWNLGLSQVPQYMANSQFWGSLAQSAHKFARFLAIFGPFLGDMVELQGNKGRFLTRQSRRTCIVRTISLCLLLLTWFWGRFGPKKGSFGAQNAQFCEGASQLGALPRGATGEFFLAQNLDLARA